MLISLVGRFCRIAPCLVALSCLHLGLEAADPDQVYSVHVRFVNASGESIRDLQAQEITVADAGTPLKIESITGPDAPFHVGLLLDVSPSIESRIDDVRDSTQAFFSTLRAIDEGMILTFDSKVYLDCDWTTDRRRIDDAIFEIGLHKTGGKSILYDAVAVALEQKLLQRSQRQALLLLSDGAENGSKDTREKESLKLARRLGFPVFAVQFDAREHYRRLFTDPDYDPVFEPVGAGGETVGGIFVGGGGTKRQVGEYKAEKTMELATRYMKQIAQISGGEYHMETRNGGLRGIYQRVLDSLFDVYTLRVVIPAKSRQDRLYPLTISTSRTHSRAEPLTKGYWPREN